MATRAQSGERFFGTFQTKAGPVDIMVKVRWDPDKVPDQLAFDALDDVLRNCHYDVTKAMRQSSV